VDNAAVEAATTAPARAPGLPGPPLLGDLMSMRRDPLGTLRALAARGEVTLLRLGLHHAHLFVRPEHLERILLDDRYEKRFRTYKKMKIVLGEGLITSNGERWRQSRQLAQPALHKSRIGAYAGAMARAAERSCEAWSDGERDMLGEMLTLSQQIVSETLFGAAGPGDDEAAVAAALGEASAQLSARMLQIVDLPLWIPTRANRRLRAAIRAIDARVASLVAVRRREGGPRDDLLGMLLEGGLDDRQLRDELVTLFTAGQETVACTLSWALWLLSRHAEAERALHDELRRVLGGRPAGIDDLPQLPWTRMIVQEALRLYPPLWLLNRTVREEDEIGGYRIRRGSQVFFSPYLTHRHPALFPEPDAFQPQRFADEGRWPRFAFLPFSGGQRQCIGHAFAMVEAQIVLATIAQRWQLEPAGPPLEVEAGVTLRPKGRVLVRLRRH
jgi:cytochrome P450